jgi:hypothetical protein
MNHVYVFHQNASNGPVSYESLSTCLSDTSSPQPATRPGVSLTCGCTVWCVTCRAGECSRHMCPVPHHRQDGGCGAQQPAAGRVLRDRHHRAHTGQAGV